MTHYLSNEEVEKEFGDQRLGWPDFCGNEDHQCECSVKEEAIKSFISQTRLSDLDAIIDGVEKYWKVAHSARLTAGVFKEYILDYLTSLKENKV